MLRDFDLTDFVEKRIVVYFTDATTIKGWLFQFTVDTDGRLCSIGLISDDKKVWINGTNVDFILEAD